MVASADTQWHWLTQEGVRQSGGQAELSAALASGALLATTLVWRTGWAEWLAANIVAELAQAVPADQRVPSREPKRDPSLLTPPALPVKAPPPPLRNKPPKPAKPAKPAKSSEDAGPHSGLPPLAPNIVSRLDPKKDAADDPAKDTLAPTSFGTIGRQRPAPQPIAVREPTGPAAPLRNRDPMPTLTEETQSATATLRPPGAVPPPARGVPAVPALDSAPSYALDKRSAVTTPVPTIEPSSRPEHEVVRADEISDADPSPATEPRYVPQIPARSLPPVRDVSLPAARKRAASYDQPLDSTLEVAQGIPSAARRTPLPAARELGPQEDTEPRRSSISRSSLTRVSGIGIDSRTVMLALSAACTALAVTVVLLLFTHPRAPGAAALPASASSSDDKSPAVDHTCRVALPAARLAANIERAVAPSTVAVEGGVAVGFASSKTHSSGLLIDPSTLDATPVFDDDGKDPLRGVVPLTRGERVSFQSDRDDSHGRVSHLVDEKPPFSLGAGDGGFSRSQGGSSTLIWPLEADAKLTEPRVASVGAAGYGLTFRQGGQSGKIELGFVDRQGQKGSELFELQGTPKLLGTPVIAGSENGVVVAFAGRGTADAPWKIFVATAAIAHQPGPVRELVGGAGGGAISPAISALGGGRWLMQWTEGASGQYQVRVQTFTSDLIAFGSPQLVSPKGANAGQGAVAPLDKSALSLFILTTAGHDELWGASLSCP